MSTTTEKAAWVQALEVPERPTATDVRAFFGIPPDPESQLDANISKKRRVWNSKIRSRKPTPAAEAQVKAAIKLIVFLADELKRGGEGPYDLSELDDIFREAPKAKVGELADLWELIERLLASGKLDEALKVANDARNRFTDSVVPHAVFAWVGAQVSRQSPDADNRLREDALRSADIAVEDSDAQPEAFEARAVLQLDLNRGPEALVTLQSAERRLVDGLTGVLEVLMVEAYVAAGQIDEAVTRAIVAVEDDPTNLATRSTIAMALVNAVQFSLLPIASAQGLAHYRRVVDVAAWCAIGAPEAEDTVRPFRMWAIVADNRMYAGDVGNRAYAGVLTGFLILPLLNRLRSKQQWQIIDKGPDSVGLDVFDEVALGAVSMHVHEKISGRLPWWKDYMADVNRRANSDRKSS